MKVANDEDDDQAGLVGLASNGAFDGQIGEHDLLPKPKRHSRRSVIIQYYVVSYSVIIEIGLEFYPASLSLGNT